MLKRKKKVVLEENSEVRAREQSKEPQNDFPFSWLLLALFISAAYVPFLGDRYARTAGDDKVYVAQALEMQRDGRLFVQTLSDEPDYRKGPFHYLALRAGIAVFGKHNMWATVYMNLILVVMGALAVGWLAGRHLGGDSGWAFWAGTAFALNAGIYSHVFASQMEVELAALFAIALLFLDRAGKDGKSDWMFWLVAGLAGTVKAPLHSVFLGVTAILFWTAEGTLRPRLRNARAWAGVALGIAVCGLAYLPPLLFDRENFFRTFFGRENFEKGANGAPWHYPVIPLFTYTLLPWTLAAFVAYADGIRRFVNRAREWKREKRVKVVLTSGHERLVTMGGCLILPSVVFFLFHAYRGQNYHMPVTGGLILLIAALWATAEARWKKAYIGAIALTGAILLLVPIAVTVLCAHFRPMPDWWWDWTLPCLWVGAVMTAKGFWDECFLFDLVRPAALARRSIWIFWGVSVFLVNIGEREMVDLRAHYREAVKAKPALQYAYFNLHRNVWSEWGYLNFWAGVPTVGVHTEAGLKAAVLRGDVLLIPTEQMLKETFKIRQRLFPNHEMKVAQTWRRWQTKGKNADGEMVWQEAWRTKNLARLEKKYFIVEVKAPPGT